MSLRIFGAKDTSSAVVFIELVRRDHWSDFSVLVGELWRERFQNSTLHCVPLIADDRVLALKAVDVGAGSAIEVGSDPLEPGMIKMIRKSEEEPFEGMIRIVIFFGAFERSLEKRLPLLCVGWRATGASGLVQIIVAIPISYDSYLLRGMMCPPPGRRLPYHGMIPGPMGWDIPYFFPHSA